MRDPQDNRTNLYMLGLAHSSAGKDWPRKLNTRILDECGMLDCLGDKFSSGEGIQDALYLTPSMLFQNDEIDGLLQTINKSKDARYEGIMSTLLTFYTSSNNIYPMRRKANQEKAGQDKAVLSIDQPCLVMFGTAVPQHYYEALSGRMLTNGFLARWLTVESGKRRPGQDAGIITVPPRVLTTAIWWKEYKPSKGNLEGWHPEPKIVDYSDDAKALATEARLEFDAEYSKAEDRSDAVAMTVWGRAIEHTRKLALVYAVSESHQEPQVGTAAVNWAREFVTLQSQRLLFNAGLHVAENPFHDLCQRLKRLLAREPDKTMFRSKVLKRLKVDASSLDKAIGTLSQQGDVGAEERPTAGRTATVYRLLRM